jgi:hypothetical protein
MSCACCTDESATQSTPVTGRSRGPCGLGRHRRQRHHEVGQVDALAVADRACNLDSVSIDLPCARDAQAHLAVIDQQDAVWFGRLEDLGMGSGTRVRCPARGACRAELGLSSTPSDLWRGRRPELRPLQVHRDGDRVLVLFPGRGQVDPLAWSSSRDEIGRKVGDVDTDAGGRRAGPGCHDLVKRVRRMLQSSASAMIL